MQEIKMTDEKIKKALECCSKKGSCTEECPLYRVAGCFEELHKLVLSRICLQEADNETAIAEALEKQIPVKPNGEYCPCCKRHLRKPKVSIGYTGKVKNRNGDAYCPSCGQRIDWSDTE